MALVIHKGDTDAQMVFRKGRDLNGKKCLGVEEGGYGVINNTTETTALATSGALSCMIILVHKAQGHGALGHFPGHGDPKIIIKGVGEMVKALGGLKVENVVLAAGLVERDAEEYTVKTEGSGNLTELFSGKSEVPIGKTETPGSKAQQAQLQYETAIVEGVQSMCPGATVVWSKTLEGDPWGCCYYLPLEEKVGLLDEYPGHFAGQGSIENKVTLYTFARTS